MPLATCRGSHGQAQSPRIAGGTTGATLSVNAFAAAASKLVTVPFTFKFGGTDFGNNLNGGVYFTSKGHIVFGRSVISGTGISAANPAARSVHVTAADSSWQRLYVHNQTTPVRRLRVRFEGYSGLAQLAAPNVVWEASFWPNNTLTICVGATNALTASTTALSGVSNGAGTWLASFKAALRMQYTVNNLAVYN
jgi:hypothetical protein